MRKIVVHEPSKSHEIKRGISVDVENGQMTFLNVSDKDVGRVKMHFVKSSRKSWDAYFMELAEKVAGRATCIRRKVGAILVDNDNHIVTTGYNGAPAGLQHCAETGCMREQLGIPSGERHELCRAVHAEANAIIQAAKHGCSTKGTTLYVTTTPCNMCAKMIINAGIQRVVYGGEYPDVNGIAMLDNANVTLSRFEDSQSSLSDEL